MKKLYLISQSVNTGYDTFDSAVVCAETEAQAKNIHPATYKTGIDPEDYSWAQNVKYVTAVCIGTAEDNIELGSVICASFNAG